MRKELTAAEKEYAIGCLRASAADHGGTPAWADVERLTGRDQRVLRRLWMAAGRGAVKGAPPAQVGGMDPATTTDPDYWRWRWDQVQAELGRAESDVARERLLKAQDEIRARLVEATAAERDRVPTDPEEVARMIEDQAASLPPALAVRLVAVLRRRGLVA